jgi:sigma-B regulation protein RsbU (phosphoserine phosphatase)
MLSHKLIYASCGHPPAFLFSGSSLEHNQMHQLRTPNFIMGGKRDITYQRKTQEIYRPSRLYIFSDGVYDITKADGSIWGFNEFLDFSVRSFNGDHSNLDRLLSYARELSQNEDFDDDFTILEIVFE